jgi:tetratricopeptide (TPR) repeat protein
MAAAVMLIAGLAAAQAPAPGLAQAGPDAAARTQRLDALLARLQTANDEQEGDEAVAEIWKLWQQSGTQELDELLAQANGMMGHGLHPLALPILDDIVARAPNWAEGWNKRATALYLVGEHERSLADIDRVLALEPRHFGALAGIGLNRIARGEFREALAAYRKAVAVNPFLRERLELIPALEKKLGDKRT